MSPFELNEKYLSQIPALQVLVGMGYEYLAPAQVLPERQHRLGNVLLEGILREQLKRLNRIRYRGNEYLFSEENIQGAVQRLKNVKYDGLLRTNETVYDLLTLGTALEQTIEGDSKSFDLHYVDWRNPERNVFHVTAEFAVERTRSTETARPDIVLFVNGIPLAVIECKAPSEDVEQAVSQSIRNQGDKYIPRIFVYAQLVMGLNKNAARYGTVGTAKGFWSSWKVPEAFQRKRDEEELRELCAANPSADRVFSGPFAEARPHFEAQTAEGPRLVTEQDRALYHLCRPDRLLDLAYRFTLFDAGIKKIARYQQFYVVKSTLDRIRRLDEDGRRKGGIIWHTQGSGKSLSMVMLTRSLAIDPAIRNPRIVLVTDRDDLDKQLGNTFAACGLDPQRATSGRHLLDLVAEHRATIMTTLVHKFDKALNARKFVDDSPDIFVLVDESHRSHFGSMAARMRQLFPRACYLGFTGTPLLKKEKNNFLKFGGLIDPHYSIHQAVEDEAVVRLLYEGRHVEMTQNKAAVDRWFERHTRGLTPKQQADLKKKYARAEMLNKAEQVVYMRAFDISEHYRAAWQGTGFKAQLVAPSRAVALKYQQFLRDIGQVSSEVAISSPDTREGYEETDEEPTDEVVAFWRKIMARYGGEGEYTKQIINQFKFGTEPEILIVVSKLLTGFDAPRNTVIYLCKELREHTLLQAIARVNRICEDKDFGYVVDYVGLLGELDKALTMYGALEGYDAEDLAGALTAVSEEVAKLPQRYSDLWDLFKEVKNRYDEEAYEVLLGDEAVREMFYERLASFSKTLAVALSTERFVMETDEKLLTRYRADLKRFQKLKTAVKLRYAEAVDYRDHEPKIKKLLDTQIQANEVVQLNEPVDIFDDSAFGQVKEQRGVYGGKSTSARADTIAHATKKVITESMEDDPAFYARFSRLIQQAIDDFRAKRLSDLAYLSRVSEIRDKVVSGYHEDVPDRLSGNDDATAYYGVLTPLLHEVAPEAAEEVASDTALAVHDILQRHSKVQFWDDDDAQKRAVNDIDDFLFDEVVGSRGIPLETEQMDKLIERVMRVARHRSGR